MSIDTFHNMADQSLFIQINVDFACSNNEDLS